MKQLPISVLDKIVFEAFEENTIKSVKRVNSDCYVIYDCYSVYGSFKMYYCEKDNKYHSIELTLFNSYENAYSKIIFSINQAVCNANENLRGKQQ